MSTSNDDPQLLEVSPGYGHAGDSLFELRRTTFDTPHFRGIEFIEVEAKSVLNHVPGDYLPFNWTINPYRGCSHACTYCFARATHAYMDMSPGRDFETKIVVKVNAPAVLRRELRSRRWKGETVAMGTATDPYQRAEGRYKLMRGIIETLAEFRNPFSILTKGTLILRDIELLAAATEVTDVSAAFSIGTLDEEVWRKSEPGTPHPRKRMDAVRRLNDCGISCGVMVAPILPGLSDDLDQLKDVVSAAVEAGATHVAPILLHLRPKVKEVYMDWLAGNFPQLVERYGQLYARSAYAPKDEQNELSDKIGRLVAEDGRMRPPPARRNFRVRRSQSTASPPMQVEQLSLL